jgi:hypothetical protein
VFPLPPGLGAVKVTTALFFRPGGASTQAAGVASDVVVPSPLNFDQVGERRLPHALPPQSVPPFASARANAPEGSRWSPVAPALVAELRARSQGRQQADPELEKVRAELAERARDDGVLELAETLDAARPSDGARAEVDGADPAPAGPAAASVAPRELGGGVEREEKPSAQVEEALRVLADLVVLQTPGDLPEARTAGGPS